MGLFLWGNMIKFFGQVFRAVSGKLWTVAQNYYDAIAAGQIPNHFPIHKFGYNANIALSEEVVWTAGNGYTYLSAAETLQVSSDDTEDDDGGTGAKTIIVYGLDTNWDEVSETVTMNGTASVETSTAFLRVFRAQVALTGTGEVNAGLISIKDNADTVTLAQIVAGRGQTQMAMWTVPAGHSLFITQLNASESAGKSTRIRLYSIDRSIVNQSFRLQDELVVSSGDSGREYRLLLKFTEKTDIEVRGEAAVAGGNVNAGFEGYYET